MKERSAVLYANWTVIILHAFMATTAAENTLMVIITSAQNTLIKVKIFKAILDSARAHNTKVVVSWCERWLIESSCVNLQFVQQSFLVFEVRGIQPNKETEREKVTRPLLVFCVYHHDGHA